MRRHFESIRFQSGASQIFGMETLAFRPGRKYRSLQWLGKDKTATAVFRSYAAAF
jgi:hypothetical protein